MRQDSFILKYESCGVKKSLNRGFICESLLLFAVKKSWNEKRILIYSETVYGYQGKLKCQI